MKELNKIKLVTEITAELFSQIHTYNNIELFLDKIGIPRAKGVTSYTSAKVVLDTRLKSIKIDELIRIATEELGMDINHLLSEPVKSVNSPPAKPTYDSSPAKAFISHLATNKSAANIFKTALLQYNIEGFVAHDDIEPTEEWQEEIKKELNAMDFLISLHTTGFSQSVWCQQEIGFAVAKDVLIIPIKVDEDPTGFISKYQALTAENNTEAYIKKILTTLQKSKKTKDLYSAKIASKVSH